MTSRLRVDESLRALTGHLDYYDFNLDFSEVYITETPDLLGYHSSIRDIVTKDYARRVKNGEVINNPMELHRFERTISVLSGAKAHFASKPEHRYEDGGEVPFIFGASSLYGQLPLVQHAGGDTADVENLYNLAGTQARANVAEPDFEGLVFVAELRETLGMLRNPLGGLKKTLKKIRRRKRRQRFNKSRTVADFISSHWLQYRYGIMPLVYDVEDAAKAVAYLGNNPKRYTARGYANDDVQLTRTDETALARYHATRNVKTRQRTKVRAGILYELDARNSFGVGLQEVPKAVWEVVPFSFVVDWFVNTGDFVSAITPKGGVRELASWTSTEVLQDTEARTECTFDTSDGWISTSSPRAFERFTTTRKHRTTDTGMALTYEERPFEGLLGAKRIADSFALIHQILQSR